MYWRLIAFLFCFVPAFCFADIGTINGIPIDKIKTVNGVSVAKVKTWNGFQLGTVGGGGTPPDPEPELTCQIWGSNTTYTNNASVARYNLTQLYGIVFDGNSEKGSICRVDFRVVSVTGSITSKKYLAELWTLDASRNLNTFVGRSSAVMGSNSWSGVDVSFNFSSPAEFDCTTGNEYALLIKCVLTTDSDSQPGRYDESNYLNVRYNSGGNALKGNVGVARWSSAGVLSASGVNTGIAPGMKIYTMQVEE